MTNYTMWSYTDKHNKLIRLICLFISLNVAFYTPIQAIAQSSPNTNLCRHTAITFGFFNGVQTTYPQALFVISQFRRLHGTANRAEDAIRYEPFYNYSNGFEDFVETFEQRLREQEGILEGRFELFFEALNGGGTWWSNIIATLATAAGVLTGIADFYRAFAIGQLATLFRNPPTSVNYAEHRARLDNLMLEGKKLLFVAHSQGNLFVNAAYDYTRQKYEAESVKVVHIAPASPRLTGKHVLADLDLVINGLRGFGSVASVTDNIPGYLFRPPGINGNKDILGHGVLEIYINQRLDISTRVKSYISDALNTLVAPRARAASGFFTATLTWNGSGDVDLHTFEPSGSHVFYRALRGTSGFLDVDNTVADGPEHYFASCDSNILLPGTYRIAIANFARADGRTATVQVSSWSDGVLGTRSVTLGSATGDIPSIPLFNVTVFKDAETGENLVSLSQ